MYKRVSKIVFTSKVTFDLIFKIVLTSTLNPPPFKTWSLQEKDTINNYFKSTTLVKRLINAYHYNISMNCRCSQRCRVLGFATFLQEFLFETWCWSWWYFSAFRACQTERHDERCRSIGYAYTLWVACGNRPRNLSNSRQVHVLGDWNPGCWEVSGNALEAFAW